MSARGALTVRACSKCRKKKRKCDGQCPCSNCQARQEPCNYSVKEWTSKDGLRSEIQDLKRKQESAETVLGALRSPSTSGIVLEQLQRGDSVAEIEEKVLALTSRFRGTIDGGLGDFDGAVAGLRRGSSSASSSQQTGHLYDMGMMPRNSISPDGMTMGGSRMPRPMTRMSESYTSAGFESSSATTSPPLSQPLPTPLQHDSASTSSPQPPSLDSMRSGSRIFSTAVMEYHLNLLFSWECPPLTMIDRMTFLADFSAGRDRYCSPALAYAIMAVGTRLNDVLTNTDQWTAGDRQHQQHQAGRLYFERGLLLLADETRPARLPDVQALGLLSLHEVCNGNEPFARVLAERCLKGTFALLRGGSVATTMGMSPTETSSITREDVAETYAGAYSLASILELVTYSQTGALRSLSWQPWPRENDGSRARKFSDVVFDLTCIIGSTLSLPKSTEPSVVLGVYEKCLEWYNSALGVLRDAVAEGTPSSLFLHMYYHFYLGVLFRPLSDRPHNLDDDHATATITTATGDRVSPRTICTESAHAVIALAQSFQRIYTLRRTPAFQPYFVYAAGSMLIEQDRIERRVGATNAAGGGGGSCSSNHNSNNDRRRGSVESGGVALALAQLADMARCHPAAAEALEDLSGKNMVG